MIQVAMLFQIPDQDVVLWVDNRLPCPMDICHGDNGAESRSCRLRGCTTMGRKPNHDAGATDDGPRQKARTVAEDRTEEQNQSQDYRRSRGGHRSVVLNNEILVHSGDHIHSGQEHPPCRFCPWSACASEKTESN